MHNIINGFKQIGKGIQNIFNHPSVHKDKLTDADKINLDWQKVGQDMQTSLHDIKNQMPVDHSATNEAANQKEKKVD